MANPANATATQLRNIEQASGMTLTDFAKAVKAGGHEKHSQIIAFLKAKYKLTYGNANLVAHLVREQLAGGPPEAGNLLAAQYAGAKAALRPIYDKLAAIAGGMGGDVEKVVQKTGVSFRRAKQFALIQAPSAKRIQLGLNRKTAPKDKRLVDMKGMCTHKADIDDVTAIDSAVFAWIRAAYEQSARAK